MARQFLVRTLWLVLAGLVLLPATARAQSVFTGTVKDSSGAVMPGVTVEAASPVLIEKVKSAVTDENGQVPHRRSSSRPLHDDVHAHRLQHGDARSRSRRQLHGDHQHRARRRHAAGIGDGVRRLAGRRRAEQRQAAGAEPRGAERGADRRHHPGPRPARGRRHAERARRGRLARHAADLLQRPRPGRRADGGAGRRHDDQRHDGRRRRAGVSQRDDDAGSRLPDGRRQRRDDHRRRQHEPDPEGRRQPVARRGQGLQVARVVAGRQPDRRSARAERHRGRQDRQLLRVERRAGRSDPPQQAVVLRRVPPRQVRPADRQHLLHSRERARSRSASAPASRARRSANRASRTRR